MLEPPSIPENALTACLHAEYGLKPAALTFLPLGADLSTSVYRADVSDGAAFFVKVRFGPFDPLAALVSTWLAQQGVAEIIAPLPTTSAQPFAVTPDFTMLVYPFIVGHDAYEGILTDEQWVAFGRAMRRIHDAPLPPHLAGRLPVEKYDPRWREQLRRALIELDSASAPDSAGLRLAEFMAERRAYVLDLVARTERLARTLGDAELPPVLCHTDLHPGNLLICPDGRFFIVDWDAPLLAPRERDLMYPGGAQGFPGRTPEEEEALFFEGYGPADVDLRAVAYYRLERVIEDLAIFCYQLLGASEGSAADREQALGWAMSNFLPGHTLEIAERTSRQSGVA